MLKIKWDNKNVNYNEMIYNKSVKDNKQTKPKAATQHFQKGLD